VIAAVMMREIEWDRLPKDLPAPVLRLLKRCLEKDRRKRVADISTGLFVLDEAFSLAGTPQARVSADCGLAVGRRRAVALGVAAPVLAAVVTGATVWVATRPAPAAVVWTAVPTTDEATLSPCGVDRDIAITPDGTKIVYRGGNGRMLIRGLDSPAPVILDALGYARGPFVSPDGQWIGYLDGSTIKRVAFTGGSPVTVATTDGASRGATWGEDGTIVSATAAGTGLQRVSGGGGDPTVLTHLDPGRGDADHMWPEFLPARRAVLFTIVPVSGDPRARLERHESTYLQRGER
jgi:serine/threonine-protein kinase